MTETTKTKPNGKAPELTGFDLGRHAMLVRLKVHMWTGVVADEQVTAEVASLKKARKGAGSYRKRLIAGKELQEVRRVISATRKFHRSNTMPWEDSTGERLLSVDAYASYKTTMDRLAEELNDARNRFLEAYPRMIEEAKGRLGTMFDRSEFPSPDQLKRAVWTEWDARQVPEGNHLTIDIGERELKRLQDRINERTHQQLSTGISSLYQRVQNTVESLREKLSEDEGGVPRVFRDSILQDCRNTIGVCRQLNFIGDARLDDLSNKVLAALESVEPNQLRPGKKEFDEQKREEVKTSLDEVAGMFFASPEASGDDARS